MLQVVGPAGEENREITFTKYGAGSSPAHSLHCNSLAGVTCSLAATIAH